MIFDPTLKSLGFEVGVDHDIQYVHPSGIIAHYRPKHNEVEFFKRQGMALVPCGVAHTVIEIAKIIRSFGLLTPEKEAIVKTILKPPSNEDIMRILGQEGFVSNDA